MKQIASSVEEDGCFFKWIYFGKDDFDNIDLRHGWLGFEAGAATLYNI